MEKRIKLALTLLGILMVIAAPVANAEPVNLTTLLNAINAARDAILTKLGVIETKVDSVENKLDHLDLQVAIDLSYCGTGAVQCGVHGGPVAGASSTNHNLIRIAVLVTRHGSPVGGLTDPDLVFVNSFVPAGGGAAVEFNPAACAPNCFQPFGDLYVFFIDRFAAGNWDAGHYFGTETVTDPATGDTGKAIVDWEIV